MYIFFIYASSFYWLSNVSVKRVLKREAQRLFLKVRAVWNTADLNALLCET